MPLTPGSRLGPYEILAPLGAGGMGEVWRARDTRLDREVAIKTLPAQFAKNAQLRVRFEREARLISQLNHPNICTLYDVGDDYLVMELIQGESLADRLARGPLPLVEVLRAGAQIADALDRAHRHGIVHRDLKPGNVMLTKSGAKLLDFGLAKSNEGAVVDANAPTQAHKPLTQEGAIVGTFQYMAPEQIEGHDADARTDVFALGCVLYEMTTGRRAFDGATRTSVIAAIVASEPAPVSQFQPLTPPALEHVIRRCLAKDRDDRWQSAHDVAGELRWIGEMGSQAGVMSPGVVRRKTRERLLWSSALVAALLAAVFFYVRSRPRAAPVTTLSILAPAGYEVRSAPAISPDGRTIAFVLQGDDQNRSLWIRRLGDAEPVQLTTCGYGWPFWSPDGEWIAYFNFDKLRRIRVSGGAPEEIASTGGYGLGGTWSKEGTIVFAPAFGKALMRVRAVGGVPQPLTQLDRKRGESAHLSPQFIDDRRYLYLVRRTPKDRGEIWLGSLDGAAPRKINEADALIGIRGGSMVFVRDGVLYAQVLDTGAAAAIGDPVRIASGVEYSENWTMAWAGVAPNGTATFVPASTPLVEFQWLDRSGRLVGRAGQFEGVSQPDLSPDNTRAAVTRWNMTKGANELAVIDLARGTLSVITNSRAEHQAPHWIDDQRIGYSSDAEGLYDIYEQTEDPAVPARLLWHSMNDKNLTAVTADGREGVVLLESNGTTQEAWLMSFADPAHAVPLLRAPMYHRTASISPKRTWVSFIARTGITTDAFLRRFDGGRTYQLSKNGAQETWFGPADDEVFFRSDDGGVHLVSIANGTPSEEKLLFVPPRLSSDRLPLSRDGQRFLAPVIVSTPAPSITVVSGW